MTKPHPGRTLRQPTGVWCFLLDRRASSRPGDGLPCTSIAARWGGLRPWLLGSLLALLWALPSGCQPGPEAFAPKLDAAMASGDLAEVLPLLTRRSRAVVRSLGVKSLAWAQSAKAGSPQAGSVFLPRGGQATEVVSVRTVRSGGRTAVVLEVRAGEGSQEWVLRQEDGGWRLDLLSTADRLPL